MALEWLIDLLKEYCDTKHAECIAYVEQLHIACLKWVSDQDYLQTSYVDRGVIAGYDYEAGDFTRDGAWHDLDLSAIVPAGAKAVAFSMQINATTIAKFMKLKKKGAGAAWYFAGTVTQVANITNWGDLVCAVDANRKIEYAISVATWTFIRLTVKGWWL